MKSSITTKLCALLAVVLLLVTLLCSCKTDDLQAQLDEVETKVANAQGAAEKAGTDAADALTAATKTLNDAITEVKTALETKAPATDLADAKANLEKAIADAQAAYAAADADLHAKLEKAIEDARATYAAADTQLKAEIDALKAEYTAAVEQLNGAIAQINTALDGKASIGELQDARTALQNAINSLTDRATAAETILNALGETYLTKAEAEALATKDALNEAKDALNDALDDAKDALEEADATLQNKINDLADKLDTANGRIGDLEEALAAVNGKLNTFKSPELTAKVEENLAALIAKKNSVNFNLYLDDEIKELDKAFNAAFVEILRATTIDEANAALAVYTYCFKPDFDEYVDTIVDQIAEMINDLLEADGKITIDEKADVEELKDFWNEWCMPATVDAAVLATTTEYEGAKGDLTGISTVKEFYDKVLELDTAAWSDYNNFVLDIKNRIDSVFADEIISEAEVSTVEGAIDAYNTGINTHPEYEDEFEDTLVKEKYDAAVIAMIATKEGVYIKEYVALVKAVKTAMTSAKIDITETGLIAKIEAAESYYDNNIDTISDVEIKDTVLDVIENYTDETFTGEDLPEYVADARDFYEDLYENFQKWAKGFAGKILSIGTVDKVTLAHGTKLDDALPAYAEWQDKVTNIDTLEILIKFDDDELKELGIPESYSYTDQPISYYVTEYNKMHLAYNALKDLYKLDAIAFINNVAGMKTNALNDYSKVLSICNALDNNLEKRNYFYYTEVDPVFDFAAGVGYNDLQSAIEDYDTLTDEYEAAAAVVFNNCVILSNAIADINYNERIDCADRAYVMAENVVNAKAALDIAVAIMDKKLVSGEYNDEEKTFTVDVFLTEWQTNIVGAIATVESKRNVLYNALEALKNAFDTTYPTVGTRYYTTFDKTVFDATYLVPVKTALAYFNGIEDRNLRGYDYVIGYAPALDLAGKTAAIDTDYEDVLVTVYKVYAIVNAQKYADSYESALDQNEKAYLENALFLHTTSIKISKLKNEAEIAAMGSETKVKEILDKNLAEYRSNLPN